MTAERRGRASAEQRRNRELSTPNADGSRLEGFVEAPRDGDEVARRCRVTGWHAWEGRPVAGVTVELDGTIIGRAHAAAEPRDDVAADRGDPAYALAGWLVDLDLDHVRAAAATLVVTVYPAADHVAVRLDPIAVMLTGVPTVDELGAPIPEDNAVVGNIDVPAPGDAVGPGPVSVKGWALTGSSPIATVSLFANGVALGLARLGLDRADVAARDDAPDAPVCGFEQLVELSAIDGATARIELTATVVALDGTVGELTTEVVARTTPDETPAASAGATSPASVSASASDGVVRLLVVTHDLAYGGAQLWLDEVLVRQGAGTKFDCTVVAFGGGPLRADLERRGIEVHVTAPLPVDDHEAYEGRLAELSAWLDARCHTAALVNTFRSFPGADLASRRGLPFVWAIHESWSEPLIWAFDHPGVTVDAQVRASAARALEAAGAVVFESEATRALYAARAPGRTVLVPYGVDTAALEAFAATTSKRAARSALGIEEASRVLLVMGTVEPRKAQTVLAEAFAQVAPTHDDAVLAFVGDLGTPYSAALAEYVARAGIAGRTRLEPVTADARTWYRACDVLVCGSDVESLPRSVLDAMALGVPVVATRVFGTAELLDDGVTGLLFEPLDLAAAVAALDRALSMTDDELGAVAARGRDLVRARYDSAGYAADVMALVEGLQASPTASPEAILARSGRAAEQPAR